jgi:hypothetical protein
MKPDPSDNAASYMYLVEARANTKSQSGDSTEIVEDPRPVRAPITPARVRLARALRVVDVGPRPFFQSAMVSLAATALLAIAIALQIRPAGALYRPQRDEIIISLAALTFVGVLALVTVLVPARERAAGFRRSPSAARRRALTRR